MSREVPTGSAPTAGARPSRLRFSMSLTRAGWGTLVLGGLFYLAAITSQSVLLLLLIGLLFGCMAMNAAMARRAIRALELEIPGSVRLTEGQQMSEPWRVRNRSPRPVGMIEVVSKAGPLLRVSSIAPDSACTVAPDLVFPSRGVYPFSASRLECGWPFDLVRARRTLAVAGEAVVYPAIYPAPVPHAAGYDAVVGGKFKGRRTTPSGAYFAGIRPLRPGDPFKHIHWKSSAKGVGLMVKSFEEELSGRIGLIMDSGHGGDKAALDDAARAAGSLVFAALEAGHHVEWIDAASLSPLLVPPYSDGGELLEQLARLEVEPGCLRIENLRRAVAGVSSRGSICLVLTVVNDAVRELVEELHSRHRSVLLCVPPGQQSAAATLGAPVLIHTRLEIIEAA